VLKFLTRRCALAVFSIWSVITLVFVLLHATPGDPAVLLLSGGGVSPSPAAVAAMRVALHLNEPLLTQYRHYLVGLMAGNFGKSFESGTSVGSELATTLPRTLELIVIAGIIALAVGVLAGTLAGWNEGSVLDRLTTSLSTVGIAVPVFVVGIVLVRLVAVSLNALPVEGYAGLGQGIGENLRYAILPALSLSFGLTAVIARITRAAVVEVRRQDWVRAARAKGVSRWTLVTRHVLRNALGAVVTISGLQLGALLGGSVLVEVLFDWPGMNQLLYNAAEQRDYPVVQGVVIVVAVGFVLINLVTDIVYGLLDPRVRRGIRSTG
jgi:peptide/nickel transport system permease protein